MGKYLNKKEIKIFITFFLIYALLIQWGGWNEISRFALTRAIAEEHRFEIDSFANQTSDRAYFNGHYYSDKEPGLSFIAIPIYATWKFLYYNFFPTSFIQNNLADSIHFTNKINNVLLFDYLNPGFFILLSMILVTVLISPLFTALTVVLIYKISKYFTQKENYKMLLVFTFGLGTLAFPSALIFSDLTVATFLCFLAFYILFKEKERKIKNNKYILFAGILVGFSVTISLITILIGLAFIIYIIYYSKKNVVYYFLGAFLGILPLFIYNFFIFGNPIVFTRDNIDQIIWPFALQVLPRSLKPFIMFRLLIDSYKGLFYYYPILLLSIPGLYFMYKQFKIESFLIIFIFLLFLLINSSLIEDWWGGAFFGPRHLTYIIPFLVIPSIFVLNNSNRLIKILFILLFVYSVFINISSLQPKVDELLGPDGVNVAEKYKSKINSFEFLANPIFDYYIPRFFEFGPRSRLIESIVNHEPLDIRFVTPESREPFIQFSEGSNNAITFVTGWQYNRTSENVIWMIKDGKILVRNDFKNQNISITFNVGTGGYEDKHLKVFLNNKEVEEILIPKNNSVRVKIDNLKNGINNIVLKTNESCKIENIIKGTGDKRCLNIFVDHVALSFE